MKLKKIINGSIIAASIFGVSLGSSVLSVQAANGNNTTSITQPNNIQPSHNASSFKRNDNNNNERNQQSSSANVKISNGLLNLDSVPNLSFGNSDINQYTTNLGLEGQGNQATNGNNNNGILQVTDNRNTNSDGTGPWSVQANLGQFYKTDNGQNIPSNDTDWAINLNQTSDQNDENTPLNPSKQSIQTNQGDKTIMSTQDDSKQGHGTNTISYDNSNEANLNIPYNVKLGQYNATINWNLTASANNSANSTNVTK